MAFGSASERHGSPREPDGIQVASDAQFVLPYSVPVDKPVQQDPGAINDNQVAVGVPGGGLEFPEAVKQLLRGGT